MFRSQALRSFMTAEFDQTSQRCAATAQTDMSSTAADQHISTSKLYIAYFNSCPCGYQTNLQCKEKSQN